MIVLFSEPAEDNGGEDGKPAKDLDPLVLIFHPHPGSAHLRHFPLTDDVCTGVALIIKGLYHRRGGPDTSTVGDIMTGDALCCFILTWCRNTSFIQRLDNFTRAISFQRQ